MSERVLAADRIDRNRREIGQRIRQARLEASGMTQRELGEQVGVTERSVAAWERGQVIPYRHMEALTSVLGVSSQWILHGEQEAPGSRRRIETEYRAVAVPVSTESPPREELSVLDEIRQSQRLMLKLLEVLEREVEDLKRQVGQQ